MCLSEACLNRSSTLAGDVISGFDDGFVRLALLVPICCGRKARCCNIVN